MQLIVHLWARCKLAASDLFSTAWESLARATRIAWRFAISLFWLRTLLAYSAFFSMGIWIGWRCNDATGATECKAALVQDVYEFQTLIAAAIALVAALITLGPARKQLRKMNIQSSVMARDVLAERVRETESRQNATKEKLNEIDPGFYRMLFPGDPEADPVIMSEWAFNAEQITDRVDVFLSKDQKRGGDPVWIDELRSTLIRDLRLLSRCLNQIHVPDSIDLHDPEYDLSDAQIAEIEAAAVHARSVLLDNISRATKRAKALDNAFENRLKQLRNLISKIDNLIVDDELTHS